MQCLNDVAKEKLTHGECPNGIKVFQAKIYAVNKINETAFGVEVQMLWVYTSTHMGRVLKLEPQLEIGYPHLEIGYPHLEIGYPHLEMGIASGDNRRLLLC